MALTEMMRVLKLKGTIAFSIWPPELFMGCFFQINGKYGSPLPEGAEPLVLWGNVDIVNNVCRLTLTILCLIGTG